MPWWAKVVIWAAVFALCAAAGGLLASRTDPFPPGVEDPGSHPAEPSGTPTDEAPPIWTGGLKADTEHRLHVGGTCRSDWRGRYRVVLLEDGSIDGIGGVATPQPWSARCDFDQEQLQVGSVELEHAPEGLDGERLEERHVQAEGSMVVRKRGAAGDVQRVEVGSARHVELHAAHGDRVHGWMINLRVHT